MDDASGSALLLDVAAVSTPIPKNFGPPFSRLRLPAKKKASSARAISLTRPPPAKSIIADVNVDMFLPIVPLKFLEVRARRVPTSAAAPRPSPLPSASKAISRSGAASKIASFAATTTASSSQAFPPFKMDDGFILGSPEQKNFKDWLPNRYHAPSDD